jgi:hypothetical protein
MLSSLKRDDIKEFSIEKPKRVYRYYSKIIIILIRPTKVDVLRERVIAQPILDLVIKWIQMVNISPQPL